MILQKCGDDPLRTAVPGPPPQVMQTLSRTGIQIISYKLNGVGGYKLNKYCASTQLSSGQFFGFRRGAVGVSFKKRGAKQPGSPEQNPRLHPFPTMMLGMPNGARRGCTDLHRGFPAAAATACRSVRNNPPAPAHHVPVWEGPPHRSAYPPP